MRYLCSIAVITVFVVFIDVLTISLGPSLIGLGKENDLSAEIGLKHTIWKKERCCFREICFLHLEQDLKLRIYWVIIP